MTVPSPRISGCDCGIAHLSAFQATRPILFVLPALAPRAAFSQVVWADGQAVRCLLRGRCLVAAEIRPRGLQRFDLIVGAVAERDVLARYEHHLPDGNRLRHGNALTGL